MSAVDLLEFKTFDASEILRELERIGGEQGRNKNDEEQTFYTLSQKAFGAFHRAKTCQ